MSTLMKTNLFVGEQPKAGYSQNFRNLHNQAASARNFGFKI